MIRICDLEKTFWVGEQKLKVADGINLTIEDGEFVSIVGRSGSGKSTLLNMIGGLLSPDSGHIYVEDRDICAMSEQELANYRGKCTAYIFQAFHLEPMYTVADNIRVGLLPLKLSKTECNREISEALKQVGLSDKEKVRVHKLSGGEKQRVAIARALAKNASVILADEPCGNLDSGNSRIIMDLLKKANSMGKTVLLVTHNEGDAAMTDRRIRICDGKVIADERT